ncbi:cytochrome P450 [Nocardia otitidiscaviarum]|uniref:cytochrome P450 n=1 Tax=Nocardia otitidiscaviarum TaxID=1823 RepID=UPI001895E468|nr:cytochrome P450 [Nocardia otitidiscaviarum]MBF6241074.1 cytochrome P450 [Nocardia otitidiscaviarum]
MSTGITDTSTGDAVFNPLDSRHIRDPYPLLRDHPPVACPFAGFRVVVSDAVSRTVLRDATSFSSQANNTVAAQATAPEKVPALSQLDAPEHTRLRALIRGQFTAKALADLEPVLAAHARAHAATAEDLVTDFAAPLPALALAEFLELPSDLVRRWVSEFTTLVGYETAPGWSDFRDQVDGLRLRRFPDLTAPERRMLVHFLVVAGVRNVTHLIGNLLHRLLISRMWPLPAEHLGAAVEESLRHEPPALWSMRTATRPCPVGDTPVAAGERIFVVTAGANRDPRRWPDPDEFRLHRPGAAGHLSFGTGPHACLGATFTRLQAQIYLRVLAETAPRLRLADGFSYRSTGDLMSRGPATLPVRRLPCP